MLMQVGANSVKSTVSGYLAVGKDQSLVDCSRRWFELHRDGVLYSFSRLTVSNLMQSLQKHSASSSLRQELWFISQC